MIPPRVSNPTNYGEWTNFYRHESPINGSLFSQLEHLNPNQNPGTEYRSALYNYHSRVVQTPTNFLGVKSIRPPPASDRRFSSINANADVSNLHILRTLPVQKIYNVLC